MLLVSSLNLKGLTMNLSLKQPNPKNIPCTAIKVMNTSNALYLFQKTLTKLSEASDLPIKIVCNEKDNYLIRQQLSDMSCQSDVYMNGDDSIPDSSVIITITLP